MKIKTLFITLLIISNASFLLSCSSSNNKLKAEVIIKESDIIKKSIGVEGMTCVGCEVTLEKKISKIRGVVSVKASHAMDKAVIKFDSTKTNVVTIAKIIKDSGYKPSKNISE